MMPSRREPVHPGEVLQEEFLIPLGISHEDLARRAKLSVGRVKDIVRGKRGVSTRTARLLARALGTTEAFWKTLQEQHEISVQRPDETLAIRVGRAWQAVTLDHGLQQTFIEPDRSERQRGVVAFSLAGVGASSVRRALRFATAFRYKTLGALRKKHGRAQRAREFDR